MNDPLGHRRESLDNSAQLGHGTSEHDDRSHLFELTRLTLDPQPPAQITPISTTVLDRCSREDDAYGGLSSQSDTGGPSIGRGTITDAVSFIQNDTIEEDITTEGTTMDGNTWIGGDVDRRKASTGSIHRSPRGSNQLEDTEATICQLLCPPSNQRRWTDNRSLEVDKGRGFDVRNALEGLAESHVITKNGAATAGSCDSLTLKKPTDAILLIRKKLNALSGCNKNRRGHTVVVKSVS